MTKEWGLHFLFSDGSLRFDVEVGRCGFCECCDSFWVFECLRFWFGKVIDVFLKKLKKKKHSNWLFMKLAIYIYIYIYIFFFCVRTHFCRFLCTFFTVILCGMNHSDKNKNRWWFQSIFHFKKKITQKSN